jgi:hypothetical protein
MARTGRRDPTLSWVVRRWGSKVRSGSYGRQTGSKVVEEAICSLCRIIPRGLSSAAATRPFTSPYLIRFHGIGAVTFEALESARRFSTGRQR